MNEAETRAVLIDPAFKAAGWRVVPQSKIKYEVIAPGRLLGAGQGQGQNNAITSWFIAIINWIDLSLHLLATLDIFLFGHE